MTGFASIDRPLAPCLFAGLSAGKAPSSLNDDERALLLSPHLATRAFRAGSYLYLATTPRPRVAVILSGWARRERVLPNGRRQILSVLLPGDLVGHASRESALASADITAIDNVTLKDIEPIIRCVHEHPDRFNGISDALEEKRLAEELRLLDHMVRLGSQPALQRMAGFLLELFKRCSAAGLVTGSSFALPLTLEMLGEAVGLSTVHTSRVLARLRGTGIAILHAGIATISDATALADLAGSTLTDEWNALRRERAAARSR